MIRRATFFFLASLLSAFPVFAFDLYRTENFSFSLKGYYKNLFFETKRAATNDDMIADINRLRTEWDAKFGKIFSAKVIWDNEVIGGDYVNSEEFALRQTQRAEPYLDMDYELVRRNDFFYGQQFYRAYARVDAGPVVFVGGRQKVDWGVMRLFSPTDLFTRLPIFDIEKDERVGATAANLAITPVQGLKINPVYAVNPDFDKTRIGGRITKTIGRFDVSALGGKFLRDDVFGFDFTGDIHKAGVRGEFIYDRAKFGKNFVQFAAGIDYGWENSLYIALEYFYNGQGTNNPLTATFFPSGSQIQSVHQNFIGLQLKYDIMPLWTISLMDIVDVNGGSTFINPETKYSPLAWLEITGGAHLPVGRQNGEFTAVPNVYYVQTKLFF